MFEDLDFSNLKLPIEPKNIIYLYLAYKLINNLDKLDINSFTRKAPVSTLSSLGNVSSTTSSNFIFLVILIVGASFMFLNNLLNRISFSSISVENLSAQDLARRQKVKDCPMKKCPLFGQTDMDSWKQWCPMKKCPAFNGCKLQKDRFCQTDNKSSLDDLKVKESSVTEESVGGQSTTEN